MAATRLLLCAVAGVCVWCVCVCVCVCVVLPVHLLWLRLCAVAGVCAYCAVAVWLACVRAQTALDAALARSSELEAQVLSLEATLREYHPPTPINDTKRTPVLCERLRVVSVGVALFADMVRCLTLIYPTSICARACMVALVPMRGSL
eukprot:COSAG05_NODE_1282_length_5283_cov_4.584684_3_plen_148_part_00